MNILFLEGDMSRQGGTERMTALLANKLSETDKVSVISLSFQGNQVFFRLGNAVEHVVAPQNAGYYQKIKYLRRTLREKQIDYLINVDVGTCIFGIPACVTTRTKVITWEHANYFNNWNSRVFPYFRRFGTKHSDVMVVLTERDKENYCTNIPSKTPVYAIPNPVERHDFCYDAESKTILSAGLLLPIKGYDRAIQAAAQILPHYPDWKWMICGEGPERAHLEELIVQNSLQGQVFLLGTVSNMAEQYQNAAMFVMTSEMEGLPMVLLEAKSWGLPLVSFDIMTGPSDIIQDGVNGYLVEPYDTQALVTCIEELICSKEKRMLFSDNSQLDMEEFDFEQIVEKWRKVMEV